MKNKKLRNLIIAGAAIASPIVINKSVFLIASKKYPMLDAIHTYDWRLGKIGYSVKGNGKPVVLIHGAKPGSSSAVWLKNANELSEKYKVYSLDLLGYGTSERINTTYTAYTYASLINDFIEDVVGRPAAVIAEGEGAMFAAAAYTKNPKNIKKMILICPKGINSPFASNKDKRTRKLYELPVIGESIYLMNTTYMCIKNMLRGMIFAESNMKILTEKFYSSAHYMGALNRFVFASYKTNFMNTDIKPYIENFKVPTLFIWGEDAEDIVCFEEIQGLSDKAEYALFEETSNLPNYENAEEFNKLAIEFLQKK